MVSFTYIQTQEQLDAIVSEWGKEKTVAVDLECENNLHHYGVYITLMQVSTPTGNWIIDVMEIKEIGSFLRLLEDKSIEKIFHDVSFDLRILNHQFQCKPKNVFDTQMAAYLLGKEKVGLGSLLEEYFDIAKERRYQRVDWTKRPLSLGMLTYAAKDTAYLLQLKEKLVTELRKKNRLTWMEEETEFLNGVEFVYQQQEYMGVSGVKKMTAEQRGRFKALFELRENVAENVDRPVFMVIRNKLLLELAEKPPKGLHGWKKLRGVHPMVRKEAEQWFRVIKHARDDVYVKPEVKRLSLKEYQWSKRLLELRNTIAEQLGIQGYLIMNTEQMRDVVVSRSLGSLKKWQQSVVNKKKLVKEIIS